VINFMIPSLYPADRRSNIQQKDGKVGPGSDLDAAMTTEFPASTRNHIPVIQVAAYQSLIQLL
jgi:hypothetical protein